MKYQWKSIDTFIEWAERPEQANKEYRSLQQMNRNCKIYQIYCRKKLKKIMKQNGDKLYKRKYREKDIKQCEREISNVESDYYDILKAEKVEKEMEMAEIEMKKA